MSITSICLPAQAGVVIRKKCPAGDAGLTLGEEKDVCAAMDEAHNAQTAGVTAATAGWAGSRKIGEVVTARGPSLARAREVVERRR